MMEWVRLSASAVLLFLGLLIFLAAAVGVNKFKKALNRIHAAALGDTLGILFMTLGLVVWKGISFASFKLLLVVLFFWLASPVAGHMISRLEVMTDEDLGEIEVEHREDI
ncbi:MAG: monovalent cation/H(+) antiporter subunit G [Lachnospiraceae bacterium]|jgi:multicomponent Na+:H+ antiporter subunit G|nr:monovalent cation/H(+) antiporter subunit G [Lachnospiraceae bacterium]